MAEYKTLLYFDLVAAAAERAQTYRSDYSGHSAASKLTLAQKISLVNDNATIVAAIQYIVPLM